MITTDIVNIQGLISANAKLATGVQFMHTMRSEGLLEACKGYFPAILGGAVRDGLFLNREIHDIDIFLFRDSRSPVATDVDRTSNGVRNSVGEIRQNILAWLEDMEIEHQSLLSDRASAYFGSNQFSEILQFVWNDVTIQIMIPTAEMMSTSIDNLLRTMPIFSGVALTMDYLRMFDTTLAHYYLPENHYFVATDRDVPYLRNKAPNGILIPVSTARESVLMTLGQRFWHTAPMPTTGMPLGDGQNTFLNMNATPHITARAFMEKLGLERGMVNQSSASPTNRV